MRAVLVVLAACGSTANVPGERAPAIAVAEIARDTLCVTHGSLGSQHITEPTVRAFARNSRGDAASLAFRYLGPTATVRELASGQARHQVGLKLRAQDGCNVVYVMWVRAFEFAQQPGRSRRNFS